MIRKAVAFGLVCIVFSGVSYAAPHKVINLKLKTDIDGQEREVSICARPSPGSSSLPGHMFVAFSSVNPEGKRSYTALGHTTSATPSKALLSYTKLIEGVAGQIKEEIYSDAKEKCLVIMVNKDAYERALSIAKPSIDKFIDDKSGPLTLSYKLGEQDCMTLAVNTAKAISNQIKVPERGSTELPMQYVRRLIDSN